MYRFTDSAHWIIASKVVRNFLSAVVVKACKKSFG